jgi:hypothetical protein
MLNLTNVTAIRQILEVFQIWVNISLNKRLGKKYGRKEGRR